MILIKGLIFILIFISCTYLGILISKKYTNRVKELKEFKNALNIIETKIKFTYEPLGEIFKEISSSFSTNISNIFINTCDNMKNYNVSKAWELAIENGNTYMIKEDKEVLKSLGKLLGKTDVDGQISQIEQTSEFLNNQIEKAEAERVKNEKLYKTLGIVSGAGLVILLI